jgi:hypothetical protein
VPSLLEYSLDPIEKRVYKLTFDNAADPPTYTEVDLGLYIESLKKVGSASLSSRLPSKKGGSKGSNVSAPMRKGFETEYEGPFGSKPRSVSKDPKKEVADPNVLSSDSLSSSMDDEDHLFKLEDHKNQLKQPHQPKQFYSQLQYP